MLAAEGALSPGQDHELVASLRDAPQSRDLRRLPWQSLFY